MHSIALSQIRVPFVSIEKPVCGDLLCNCPLVIGDFPMKTCENIDLQRFSQGISPIKWQPCDQAGPKMPCTPRPTQCVGGKGGWKCCG